MNHAMFLYSRPFFLQKDNYAAFFLSSSPPIFIFLTVFTLLLLSPTLLVLTAAELTCYYPDTIVATDHIPCNATASDTLDDDFACCPGNGNDYCLANVLCWYDGVLNRGSCTDKNWASPSCAQWCQKGIRVLTPCSVLRYLRGGLILAIEQRNTSMNLFPCRQEGVWQCEWHI